MNIPQRVQVAKMAAMHAHGVSAVEYHAIRRGNYNHSHRLPPVRARRDVAYILIHELPFMGMEWAMVNAGYAGYNGNTTAEAITHPDYHCEAYPFYENMMKYLKSMIAMPILDPVIVYTRLPN